MSSPGKGSYQLRRIFLFGGVMNEKYDNADISFSTCLIPVKPDGKNYDKSSEEYHHIFSTVFDFYALIVDAIYKAYYYNRYKKLYGRKPPEIKSVEEKIANDLKELLLEIFYDIELSIIDKRKMAQLNKAKVLLFKNAEERFRYFSQNIKCAVFGLDEEYICNDIRNCFDEFSSILDVAEIDSVISLNPKTIRKQKKLVAGTAIKYKNWNEYIGAILFNYRKYKRPSIAIRKAIGDEDYTSSGDGDFSNIRSNYINKIRKIDFDAERTYEESIAKYRTDL